MSAPLVKWEPPADAEDEGVVVVPLEDGVDKNAEAGGIPVAKAILDGASG